MYCIPLLKLQQSYGTGTDLLKSLNFFAKFSLISLVNSLISLINNYVVVRVPTDGTQTRVPSAGHQVVFPFW